MKNILKNKCPACNSSNIRAPKGLIPWLYSVNPFICSNCGAEFEPNIISRIGFWVFMGAIFLPFIFMNYLVTTLGKDLFGTIFLYFIGVFFILIIFGSIIEIYKPWQYKLRTGSNIKRKVINYGALSTIVLYFVIFYAIKV